MNMSDLRAALLVDPWVGVDYIILNNAEAVAERLRGLDIVVSSPDDIREAIATLREKGDFANIKYVLSVPMNLAEMSSDEVLIAQDVARAHQRRAQ